MPEAVLTILKLCLLALLYLFFLRVLRAVWSEVREPAAAPAPLAALLQVDRLHSEHTYVLVLKTVAAGGTVRVTRNLWTCVVHHAAWNFTILLSGVPLSGIDDWRALTPLHSRLAGPDWLTGGTLPPSFCPVEGRG